MTVSDLQKQIGKLEQNQAEKDFQEYLKVLRDIYAHQFNKATAYATVVTMAGYAGLFTMWNLTRDYMSPTQVYSTALFASISLVFFVMYEIYKMCVYETQFSRLQKAIETPYPQAMEEVKKANDENSVEELRQSKIWPWVFGATVVTGLASAFILIYSFMTGLFVEVFLR